MHIRSRKKHDGELKLQDIVGMDKEGNEIRIEDRLPDTKEPLEEQVALKVLIHKLRDVVARVLQDREKRVIEMRYGLGNNIEMTQNAIAEKLAISRSYVSRIEKKALCKIRKELDVSP